MAGIKFVSEEAHKRWCECNQMSRGMDNSLEKVTSRFLSWYPHDATINIGPDWDDKSFYFWEEYADGRKGMNGGIIFHGPRDRGGDGGAPTFSVCLSPCDGYAIHT